MNAKNTKRLTALIQNLTELQEELEDIFAIEGAKVESLENSSLAMDEVLLDQISDLEAACGTMEDLISYLNDAKG